MVKKKKPKLIVVLVLALIIIGLWICGIIPQQAGKMASINYVRSHYSNMGLKFCKMEFSSAHGNYFVVFKDSSGKIYNFLMTPRFLPINILYDPLNPPG